MDELQYSERLAILEAETLEHRRLKADLMYLYKILFGLSHVGPATLYIKLMDGTNIKLGTHCHAFCVEEIHDRINPRRHFLSLRIARVWNRLPANATNYRTIHVFKKP